MAATGNEVVILKQLKDLYDTIKTSIATKVSKPTVGDGTSGQMLVTNGDGTTSWVDQPGEGVVGSGDLADNAVTTDKINDGAVTTAKIGSGAVTSDKIADGTIATGDIANDAITADKIASDAVTGDKIATGAVTSDSIQDGTIQAFDIAAGVIPDVSGFITEAEANEAYQPKGSYLTSVPKATEAALGGIMLGYAESDKNYPVELDGSGKAFVNVPWTDTNTTYNVATAGSDGLMSSEDKAKLDGLSNYVLPEATSTTLGGVKVATDGDAKAFLGY